MHRLYLSLIAVLFPVLTASGFSVSGNVSGRDGLALTYVYTVPTTLDTFYVAIANFLTGDYSQSNLAEGSYILFAFQDANFSFLPDPDESRGFYGGEVPQTLEVTSDLTDIDIELLPPNTGGFSGTVTYDGSETGPTYVFAAQTNTFEGLPSGAGLLLNNTGNGDYTAIVDSFGVYFAFAFMDVNTNLQYDIGEPYDVYGDDLEPEPFTITQGGQFPDDINFTLIALNSSAPARPATANFELGEAYPNPFNPVTTIPFTLEKTLDVKIVAHDVLGRTVKELYSGTLGAGSHSITFDGNSLASGLYFIELRAQNLSRSISAVLLK
jgi:hypothetical protein